MVGFPAGYIGNKLKDLGKNAPEISVGSRLDSPFMII